MKRLVLFFLVLAVVRLGVMTIGPVFDPSEARYAAIAANMARTSDYVVPHFTYKGVYQSFDGKPPLVFQAGGLCCEALGVCPLAVRVFPFFSALLVLGILYLTTRSKLSVMICATTVAFYIAAGLSMTDMSLTCCVSGALLLYGKAKGNWAKVVIGALLGAGMIVKGPVAIALFALPVLADAIINHNFKKMFDWRWLVLALPVFVLVATPWFVLIEQRNPGAVKYFFYNENFLRFVSHDYGDKYGAGREAFRGVSVLWALVATLPWVILPLIKAFSSIKVAPREALTVSIGWVRRQLPNFDFLSMVVITGFWCLTSRVLVYYLFPIIPMFAAWLVANEKEQVLRRWMWPAAALSMSAAVLMYVGGVLFTDKFDGADTPYRTRGSSYAYEFYHGTHSNAVRAVEFSETAEK